MVNALARKLAQTSLEAYGRGQGRKRVACVCVSSVGPELGGKEGGKKGVDIGSRVFAF